MSDLAAPRRPAPGPAKVTRDHPMKRLGRALVPLIWVGPAIALIAVVVLWPVVEMIRTSFQKFNSLAIQIGSAGTDNFTTLFHDPNFLGILWRTLIWVVSVVAITMVISMGLAQLFNQRFPGRRVVRWALIVPWAASVMMTALIFRYMLQPDYGVINVFLHDLGIVKHFNSNQSAWLGKPSSAMPWMIFVAIFVSLPFTTYTLLAGLQAIPSDVYEAARTDGAGRWQIYKSITLPLLRPAFAVAAVINLMNVFNSFPIIWEMTRGGPGVTSATSTVYMYVLYQNSLGRAAALSIVNFVLVIAIVFAFLKLNNPTKRTS